MHAMSNVQPYAFPQLGLSLVAIRKHMFYTYKKELVRGGYMKVRRDDIASSVFRLINEAGRSPYLFVGSGFFRRHMGTVD